MKRVRILTVILICSLFTVTANLCNAQPAMRSSVSQFGITWTFSEPKLTGQFVNGDWWVVGPVTVSSVTPAPGPAPASEDRTISINQFGDTSLQDNTYMRNGSMVNPSWGSTQGYDSGAKTYSSSRSISYPYSMGTNQSLISTISHGSDLTNPKILPFYSEEAGTTIRTAAILTCLATQPPDDAFRPPYAGTWKPIFQAGNLQRHLLPNLPAVAQTPSFASIERLVERPWIDHISSWMQGATAPNENMPYYGREYARAVSLCGLRLMVDATEAQKETLLVRFVQLGIDLHGVHKTGAKWQMGGGITSGRKWPILFAGIMLNDTEMKTFKGNSDFHEDQQTYYGESFFGQTVLWQMIVHHGIAPPYEEKNPNTYTSQDDRSAGYRVCCNATAWIGEALGALLLGARKEWNHDAFFDYCDRWMTESPVPYQAYGVPTTFMQTAWDDFVDNMYHAYRDDVPSQTGATDNQKWIWVGSQGQWVTDELAPQWEYVAAHYVFYNNSIFDGYDPAINANDLNAIAPDKTALLPGESPTFANYTSYDKGINGVIFDIVGAADEITLADLEFHMGNNSLPDGWPTAPPPSAIAWQPGQGIDGSDRVVLTFNDYFIRKQWLKVTVKATANTNLAKDHVFFFGNAVGDTGNSATEAYVDATDEIECRNNPRNFLKPAVIDNIHDFNRDGKVDATDEIIARNNLTSLFNALRFFDP